MTASAPAIAPVIAERSRTSAQMTVTRSMPRARSALRARSGCRTATRTAVPSDARRRTRRRPRNPVPPKTLTVVMAFGLICRRSSASPEVSKVSIPLLEVTQAHDARARALRTRKQGGALVHVNRAVHHGTCDVSVLLHVTFIRRQNYFAEGASASIRHRDYLAARSVAPTCAPGAASRTADSSAHPRRGRRPGALVV